MEIHSISCRNSFVGSQDDDILGEGKNKPVHETVYTIWSDFLFKKKGMTYLVITVCQGIWKIHF